jgi:hypothetical protein
MTTETLAPEILAPAPTALESAIAEACQRIAPLWPLKHFVAVNPFLGFTGQSFAATTATLRRVAKVDMLMGRDFYRQALAGGIISDDHIAAALARAPGNAAVPADVALAKAALARDPAARANGPAVVATIAEVLDRLAAGDRQASRTAFMVAAVYGHLELLRLTLLAPDIIEQFMAGQQPRRLTLMWFQRNRLIRGH